MICRYLGTFASGVATGTAHRLRAVNAHEPIHSLSAAELAAVKAAAAWYASYHASIIAERADDRSAQAIGQRDEYRSLLSGLAKLGVRMRDPLGPASGEPIVLGRRAA